VKTWILLMIVPVSSAMAYMVHERVLNRAEGVQPPLPIQTNSPSNEPDARTQGAHRTPARNSAPVTRAPVNASPRSLRAAAHDSGPMRVATSLSFRTFIHNTMPV
jgi:hypothetical protein